MLQARIPCYRRAFRVEAAIVRILKARKVMKLSELMAEVVSQLAFFKPSFRVIKQRIEALIVREYVKRDEEDANTFHYLA